VANKKGLSTGQQQQAYWNRKGYGLDWDEIRRKYEERLADDIARGVVNRETLAAQGKAVPPPKPEPFRRQPRKPRKRKRSIGTSQRGQNLRNRGPANPELIEQMASCYQEGETVAIIAERFNSNISTVRKYLRLAGVYDPGRDKGGTQKKERCVRGHDLTDPNNCYEFTIKSGKKTGQVIRACKRCTKIRNKQNWKEKRYATRTSE